MASFALGKTGEAPHGRHESERSHVFMKEAIDDKNHAEENPTALSWMSFLLLSLVWITIGILFSLQVVLFEQVRTGFAVHVALMDWGPWILISPFVLWFSQKVQISGPTWKWALPFHFALCLIIAVSIELSSQWMMDRMRPEMPMPEFSDRQPPVFAGEQPKRPEFRDAPPSERFGMPPPGPRRNAPRMVRARFHLPIYWFLVAAAHALAYHRRSIERERRALQAEARLAEAQLAALQAQINPHFLFNTLNAVALMVHENPKAAEEMVESLSEMLRVVLAASHRREVNLLEEMAFINRYLAIQQIRFEDRLTVETDIAEGALSAVVPTLILQPLVENAVVHGVALSRHPGTIRIRARVEDRRLVISVTDTGDGAENHERKVGQPVALRKGVGLSNTEARLQASYGSDFKFSLTWASEGGACSLLEVPFLTEAPAKKNVLPG